MQRLRLLLDANVLVDAQLRDLFLRLAEAGAIDIRWSAEIIAEVERALVDKLGLSAVLVRRLCETMLDTFPDALVSNYENLANGLLLPDADDRHVLAAAMVSNCDALITANTRDFPAATIAALGLHVCDADEALVSIVEQHSQLVVAVVDRQLAALTKPQVTTTAFLARLRQRAPATADALAGLLGV